MRLTLQAEPDSFEERVRQPGINYLASTPAPTADQFKSHNYWVRVLQELHDSYKGICGYSCHWIPYDTGFGTVEHFVAKTVNPRLAYEWSNYRLVCGRLNGRKGNRGRVLDPFAVITGWFEIDFPSLQVKPAPGLPQDVHAAVIDTCECLGLNDESSCIKARERYVKKYCLGSIPFDFLKEEAPFVAYEIRRQGLVDTLNNIMLYPSD